MYIYIYIYFLEIWLYYLNIEVDPFPSFLNCYPNGSATSKGFFRIFETFIDMTAFNVK